MATSNIIKKEFREGLNNMLADLVVDTTFLGAIHQDDQQWAATDWYSQAL